MGIVDAVCRRCRKPIKWLPGTMQVCGLCQEQEDEAIEDGIKLEGTERMSDHDEASDQGPMAQLDFFDAC
jgi:LSD1 subclass zinc finger protein